MKAKKRFDEAWLAVYCVTVNRNLNLLLRNALLLCSAAVGF